MSSPRGWELKRYVTEGRLVWALRCPSCATWSVLDDEQVHGRALIECSVSGCTFSSRADLSAYTE